MNGQTTADNGEAECARCSHCRADHSGPACTVAKFRGSWCLCVSFIEPVVTSVDRARATYLTVAQTYRLNVACKPIHEAWDGYPYLVGSVLTRPDWRDVDLRLMQDDTEYDAWWADNGDEWNRDPRRKLIEVAISELLREQTGLPIDFQFQRSTEANAEYNGRRNPMGMVL